MYRKGLVLGTLFLFVGAGIIPSISSQSLSVVDPNNSYVTLTAEEYAGLTTCPQADLKWDPETYKYVEVTVKNAVDMAMPGMSKDEFEFEVAPSGGTTYFANLTCEFVAVDNFTDANGKIRFMVYATTSILGDITITCTVMDVALNDADDLACNSYDCHAQNGKVELQDFALFASDYGSTNQRCDFDWDGEVLLTDFAMWAYHWGHAHPEYQP